MTLRVGELFAGYGGLGLGLAQVIDAEPVWFSEFDAAPSKILNHHWPDIPNFGDITKIDWSTVPPVDILTGGFPCQDVSLAGARAGLKDGTRSGLWSEFARAIAQLQPRMVVIENVRGLLSASAGGSLEPDPWGVGDGATRPVINALGAVLGDLANLGYDAEWCGVRAADAGAPHGRFRVFILAHAKHHGASAGKNRGSLGTFPAPWGSERVKAGTDGQPPGEGRGGTSADTGSERGNESHDVAGVGGEGVDGAGVADERSPRSGTTEWGMYRPAIERWETVTGRIAPPPTNADGKNGSHRLSAGFVEWMMGLEEGHVTDPVIGLTRNEQLKALGNGVVPQQAALAIRHLLDRMTSGLDLEGRRT